MNFFSSASKSSVLVHVGIVGIVSFFFLSWLNFLKTRRWCCVE